MKDRKTNFWDFAKEHPTTIELLGLLFMAAIIITAMIIFLS